MVDATAGEQTHVARLLVEAARKHPLLAQRMHHHHHHHHHQQQQQQQQQQALVPRQKL